MNFLETLLLDLPAIRKIFGISQNDFVKSHPYAVKYALLKADIENKKKAFKKLF